MTEIIRTDSSNADFISLVAQLDAYLAITDGDEHEFYDQFNGIENLKHVILFYEDQKAIGCGAIKEFDKNCMEVKRMFVLPETRGKGIASLLLQELEKWAKELGYTHCILETGMRQVEAVALYKKNGYASIPRYAPYEHMENSVCFKKKL
ncbi:GNAT family N-acetyltransferase [Maribacter sp. 2210JD10-5]|uniref:GNAT family N-acetyltransferase n=1 Tax=Maribacter sp. 2210JD10-5 TaxID=3386272 RepID=UPI0039BC74EC